MTILVTGGTGLVGSRLLQRLVGAGVECRGLVREGKELPKGVTPVEGDILDEASLTKALKGVSAVVHLAALFRTQDADAIWRVNLDGTRNLIAATRRSAPDARIIMASTGLIYDMDSPRPGREDDVAAPKMDYPASKLAAENELRSSGLNWSILRLGFVYGDRDGHLESVPRLLDMFKWHPAARFSMIHHRDIAVAVNLALSGAMDGRIVNTVDDAPMSVYEITELVGAALVTSAAPLANPWFGQCDGALARRLGFRPTVATVHQAIRENAL
ncbi:NAD-dependent epimerase/dehydratase family protein [Ancylobacter sp. G4_0304]|uniref:NAD-dependent epimerase/dehydratase family protein n=1 Tax=Ancylobacter sp. G4_0304 TaxID=3114289 RepID=UPI0039C67A8D